MKVVINKRAGEGFGLSEAAFEKLIEWGVPVKAYVEQRRDPVTREWLPEPSNEGEVIFDRTLSPDDPMNDALIRMVGRYWTTWIRYDRAHPLLVRVVEELGAKAGGRHAELKIVDIPPDVKWEIKEYDGRETVVEKHRTWE